MISVLIPLYNGIEFLDKTLMSVVIQSYKDWEVLIGVNGWESNSTTFQKAFALAKKLHKNIKVYDLQTKGKSASLNKLTTLAKFDWIAILDADDIWLPNKLEKQMPYLSSYDVIGTQCEYFGTMTGQPYIPTGDISTFDFFSLNPMINSSLLMKKKYAYWNESNMIIEDYELLLHLRYRDKIRFFNVDEPLVLHRLHPQSHFNHSNASHVPSLLASIRELYKI